MTDTTTATAAISKRIIFTASAPSLGHIVAIARARGSSPFGTMSETIRWALQETAKRLSETAAVETRDLG